MERQIDEIYEFIDLKVSAIFINPVDWIGAKTALEDAKKAGIKIIAIDIDVFDDRLIDISKPVTTGPGSNMIDDEEEDI